MSTRRCSGHAPAAEFRALRRRLCCAPPHAERLVEL